MARLLRAGLAGPLRSGGPASIDMEGMLRRVFGDNRVEFYQALLQSVDDGDRFARMKAALAEKKTKAAAEKKAIQESIRTIQDMMKTVSLESVRTSAVSRDTVAKQKAKLEIVDQRIKALNEDTIDAAKFKRTNAQQAKKGQQQQPGHDAPYAGTFDDKTDIENNKITVGDAWSVLQRFFGTNKTMSVSDLSDKIRNEIDRIDTSTTTGDAKFLSSVENVQNAMTSVHSALKGLFAQCVNAVGGRAPEGAAGFELEASSTEDITEATVKHATNKLITFNLELGAAIEEPVSISLVTVDTSSKSAD